jgi:glucosamine-6-phosphate deaminase
MLIKRFNDKREMAKVAAGEAASALRQAIREKGKARIIAATGAAQFDFLETLTSLPDIDWKKLEMFHLDEYIGIPASHPASFCRFLQERLLQKTGITNYHLLSAEQDPAELIRRTGEALQAEPIDVAFVGVGENGHLAFNDPPVADFEDQRAVKIVKLDLKSCRQQVGEGSFPAVESVPPYAYTLTIPTLCAAKKMICICPGKNKAQPVRDTLKGPISTKCPASILRRQPHAVLLLDAESASLL